MRAYGRLQGLVFGCVGEASPDVHALLKTMGATASTELARASGLRNARQATQRLVWQARRALGCSHWRALGNMVLSRQRHMTGDGPQRRGYGNRHGNAAAGEQGEAAATARAAQRAAQRASAARAAHGGAYAA